MLRWGLAAVLLTGCDALLRLNDIQRLPDATRDAPGDSAIDAPDATGLVAYYTFESIGATPTACAADVTGHGHDGSCMGSSPTVVTGKLGGAFYLDGSVIEIAHAIDLDPPNALTVAVWLSPNSIPDGNIACVVNRPIGSLGSDAWQICLQPSNSYFAVGSATFYPPAIPLNEWHHVALVWDGATASAWIDGQMMGQGATGPVAYDVQGIVLGADFESTGPAYYFQGGIDELRIYDRALSATELTALAK